MKRTQQGFVLALCILATSCTITTKERHCICRDGLIDSLLVHAPMRSDSTVRLVFESERNSRKFYFNKRASDGYGGQTFMTEWVFPRQFKDYSGEYLYGASRYDGQVWSSSIWYGHGFTLVDNPLQDRRWSNRDFWVPFFHRPSPIPYLNMEVAYQQRDSAWDGDVDKPYWQNDGVVAIKLYHRDSILDKLFPERKNQQTFDMVDFRQVFCCLREHFAQRYQVQHPGKPIVSLSEEYFFADKPYKDLMKHYSWISQDRLIGYELYCLPADLLRRYFLSDYDPDQHLVYDSVAKRYGTKPWTVADSTRRLEGDWVYDIREEDLAIWIVITEYSKPKERDE